MPWNRSKEKKPVEQKHLCPTWIKGLTAALIVIIGSALAWFLIGYTNSPDAASKKRAGKIADVGKKVKAKDVEMPAEVDVRSDVAKTGLLTNGAVAVDTNDSTQSVVKVEKKVYVRKNRKIPKTRIFNYRSENDIANLLRLKPGTGVFGNKTYQGFKEDFLKSFNEPIIVKHDDDDYTKELKRDVIETKADLKAQLDAGEDIEKIMRETREDFRKLAEYKRVLTKEVFSHIHKENCTAADIEDFQNAANKMLEAKGIAPMNLSPIIKHRLMKGEDL